MSRVAVSLRPPIRLGAGFLALSRPGLSAVWFTELIYSTSASKGLLKILYHTIGSREWLNTWLNTSLLSFKLPLLRDKHPHPRFPTPLLFSSRAGNHGSDMGNLMLAFYPSTACERHHASWHETEDVPGFH